MKESDALKKKCFKKFNMKPNVTTNMHVTHEDYGKRFKCEGSACIAWEPEYIRESKTFNKGELVGDDWIVQTKINGTVHAIRFVETDKGDCGLLTKECNCQC